MNKICKDCGQEYNLSEGEIQFYHSKNLSLPKRCPSCRNKNKNISEDQTVLLPYIRSKKTSTKKKSLFFPLASLSLLIVVSLLFILFFNGTLSTSDLNKLTTPNDTVINTAPTPNSTTINSSTTPTSEVSSFISDDTIETSAPTTTTVLPAVANESQRNTYYFRNAEYLSEHFEKHNSDFNYLTKEEYEAGANRVITSSNVLHKLEAEDNDNVYYLEASNEFVILSTDGYIRTYFKPDDGIDYYNRQ